MKKVVEFLKENDYSELSDNVIGYRPWGKYEILIDQPKYKVKKITVNPNSKLSLQSHKRRAEHWVVVMGEATIVNGEKNLKLKEGESTFISAGHKHRLGNNENERLEIIEVQSGDYLEEDDIVRYDDVYNRK